MQPQRSFSLDAPVPSPRAEAPEVRRALTQGLGLPLAALRASVESLDLALARNDPSRSQLGGVLREVELLGRNVQDLVDFASPSRTATLACTLEEILRTACNGLTDAQRHQLTFARHMDRPTLRADAPLLSRCLRRLVENAFEARPGRVLINASYLNDWLEIAVVDDGAREFDDEQAFEPFFTTKSNHLGLGLNLARRDMQLIGGDLELMRSPLGYSVCRLHVRVDDPTDDHRSRRGGLRLVR